MATSLEKYFIAIVPGGRIEEETTSIKEALRTQFNLKYAFRAPAHITLKMPFNWNSKKEDRLISSLKWFFESASPFGLRLKGFGKFRRSVIYVRVMRSDALHDLQSSLAQHCKTKLNLTKELSDTAYNPHVTVAFKDLKPKRFDEYWEFIQSQSIDHYLHVKKIALLKRIDGRWQVIHEFDLNSFSSEPAH